MAENAEALPEHMDGQDRNNRPDGKLKLTIDRLSEFEREVHGQRLSDPVRIRGLPWKILALRREKAAIWEEIPCLGFYLQCNTDNFDPSWRCAASAEMKVLAQKEGKVDHVRKIKHLFCAEECDWGYGQCLSFERLKDPDNGWYDEEADSIVLAIDVMADEPVGIDCSTFMPNFAVISHDYTEHEYLAKGTVKLVLPRSGANTSAKCDIGGFEWELGLQQDTDRGMDAVAITCRPSSQCRAEHLWICRAKYVVEIGERWRQPEKYLMFTGDSFGQNCHRIPVKDVEYPLRVQVDIKIYTGLPDIMPLDTNIEVKYGEEGSKSETVAVNKHVLAGVSSYFRNLFFAQWREHGAEQFVIHENDHPISAFKFMLCAALSTGLSMNEYWLDETHYLELLKLSVKYDCPVLVRHCEMALIKKSSGSFFNILEVADAFSLPQLKAHCLARVRLTELGENFAANIALTSRLSKRTREELDERLKECAKKMRILERDDDK